MYKLTESGVIRLADNAHIPAAPGNRDWMEYQEWLNEGNTPERQFTVEEIRGQKKAQIDQLRNQKIAAGLSYTFPDATTGTIQIRSQLDQMNLTGLGTAALGRKNKGRTDTFSFIDAENVQHSMTPDQMVDMGLKVQEFISGLTETARTKKDELADSIDPANYDVEVGW